MGAKTRVNIFTCVANLYFLVTSGCGGITPDRRPTPCCRLGGYCDTVKPRYMTLQGPGENVLYPRFLVTTYRQNNKTRRDVST